MSDPTPNTEPTPAPEPVPSNPFDFPRASANFEPTLAPVAQQILDRIRTIDPAHAQAAVDAIRRATEEKKSAAEVLDIVFGIFAKVGGFIL